jgi:hypothetical protein
MKRLLPFIAFIAMVLAVSTAFGQSQRMVLFEEGTNASCSPCAAANPAFNALLDANTTKCVAIKYQWYYPGFDPMHNQNPDEPNARMDYYGLNGVPHVMGDGNAFDDHPANLTQSFINTEYAVASPFTMTMTHSLSADFDSIFIELIITCTQATTGTLVAQVALEEDHIHFASAPGSNGETDFYDVMRKMLPDVNGTTLATSWAVGDDDTVTFAMPLPNYIYDVNQVCIVAFVQDNATKNVKQAVRSAPITQSGDANLDAGLSAMTNVPVMTCGTSFTPTVTLKNYKSTTLTSATINWQLDNGTILTQPWTGSLALNATANITLPDVTVTGGPHDFRVFVTNPNGGNDFYPVNNTQEKTVFVIDGASAVPYTEGFQTSVPPPDWIANDLSTNGTWKQYSVGGFGNSSKSAMLECYSITSGTYELIMPAMDLSTDTAATMTFSVAYAQYQTYSDALKVYVSTNCGSSWTQLYSKAGSTLATAPASSSYFVPTAAQWRTETIDLTTYAGQASVILKFAGTSNYGNNMFVDDINLTPTSSAGISDNIAGNAVSVYPNPFAGLTHIEVALSQESSVDIQVYNALGALVHAENASSVPAGVHQFLFDGTELPTGVYYINVMLNDQVITKKVSLVK